DVAAAPGGAPLRVPDVLVADESAPDPGQLDIRAGAVDTVGDPADAHAGARIVALEAAHVGAEPRRPDGAAHVGADLIAARQVELDPCRSRPAELVGGMAVVDRRRGDTARRVVGAAGVVHCNADTGEAPLLVDAGVQDHVGNAEAEV